MPVIGFILVIHQGRSISEEEVRQSRGGLEISCVVLVGRLWEINTEAIIGVILGDPDYDSH